MTGKEKLEFTLKILVQKSQFEQWLTTFFYLDQNLNIEYDTIYQSSYYIKLHELLTEGMTYCEHALKVLDNISNKKLEAWHKTLTDGLIGLKNSISNEELDFIQYKRHNASHIFQNAYEIQLNQNNEIHKNPRYAQNSSFTKILHLHGDDKNFDLYLTKKLHPLVVELYNSLQSIHNNSNI